MHGIAIFVKEELLFAHDLSLENSADSYLCFWLDLLHSLSYFPFPLSITFFVLCTAFESISSNINEGLSVSPSANVLVFRDFTIHHNDWLTYYGRADRPGELCYNFSISKTSDGLLCYSDPWVGNLVGTQIQICFLGFLSFFWHQYLFYNGFSSLGNSDHVVVSVYFDFPSNS